MSNTGISPKKVRPTVDLVRGRKVDEALTILKFMPSPTARCIEKVIGSAIANAENELMAQRSDLRVVEIYAGDAPLTKRFRARARGRAGRILRRSTHLTVVLDEEEE